MRSMHRGYSAALGAAARTAKDDDEDRFVSRTEAAQVIDASVPTLRRLERTVLLLRTRVQG